MPNPLMGVQRNQSKTDVERPDPVTPRMETYAGNNHPYRGTENHGVADTDGYLDPARDYSDGRKVTVWEEPEGGPDPIPVYVVSGESAKELRRGFTDRFPVTDQPVQVIGRSDSRSKVKVKNTSADQTVWLGFSREDLNMRGYPLSPGESVDSVAEDALYAMTAVPAATATLALFIEHVTVEN